MSDPDRVEPLRPRRDDPYGIGAQGQSGPPVVMIDPEKFDKARIAVYMDKLKDTGLIASILTNDIGEAEKIVQKNPELEQVLLEFLNDLGDQVRTQIASQNQVLTYGRGNLELGAIGLGALFIGPFSLQYDYQQGLACIINRPSKEQTFEALSAEAAGVEVGRLKPLPYNEAIFQYYVGRHEGQHCNQSKHQSDLDVLNREIDADYHAFEALKRQGQGEAVQAVMDIRVLGAMNYLLAGNGFPTHATAFFIGENGQKNATEDDVKVLFDVRDAMFQLVVDRLGPEANIEGARYLREMDPEKFDRLLMEGLREGPLLRPMTKAEQSGRIIEEMKASLNLSGEDIRKLDKEDPEKFDKIYAETKKKLEEQGAFRVADPAIQRIAQMYMDAHERRIQDAPNPEAPKVNVSQKSGHYDLLAHQEAAYPIPATAGVVSGLKLDWNAQNPITFASGVNTLRAEFLGAISREFTPTPAQIMIPASPTVSTTPKFA